MTVKDNEEKPFDLDWKVGGQQQGVQHPFLDTITNQSVLSLYRTEFQERQ